MENPTQENLRSSTSYPPDGGYPQSYMYPPAAPGVGYTQPNVPAPGGQPYYPQPGYGYPGPQFANYPPPPPQQQQQQQQVVVMNNQPMVGLAPPVSMCGAIVLSCFVFWFFGWVCGGIAFILAMIGQSSAAAGDIRGAIQLRNASYGLSIAGIVCGIIIIAVVAGILGSATKAVTTPSRCYNSYYGYYYTC